MSVSNLLLKVARPPSVPIVSTLDALDVYHRVIHFDCNGHQFSFLQLCSYYDRVIVPELRTVHRAVGDFLQRFAGLTIAPLEQGTRRGKKKTRSESTPSESGITNESHSLLPADCLAEGRKLQAVYEVLMLTAVYPMLLADGMIVSHGEHTVKPNGTIAPYQADFMEVLSLVRVREFLQFCLVYIQCKIETSTIMTNGAVASNTCQEGQSVEAEEVSSILLIRRATQTFYSLSRFFGTFFPHTWRRQLMLNEYERSQSLGQSKPPPMRAFLREIAQDVEGTPQIVCLRRLFRTAFFLDAVQSLGCRWLSRRLIPLAAAFVLVDCLKQRSRFLQGMISQQEKMFPLPPVLRSRSKELAQERAIDPAEGSMKQKKKQIVSVSTLDLLPNVTQLDPPIHLNPIGHAANFKSQAGAPSVLTEEEQYRLLLSRANEEIYGLLCADHKKPLSPLQQGNQCLSEEIDPTHGGVQLGLVVLPSYQILSALFALDSTPDSLSDMLRNAPEDSTPSKPNGSLHPIVEARRYIVRESCKANWVRGNQSIGSERKVVSISQEEARRQMSLEGSSPLESTGWNGILITSLIERDRTSDVLGSVTFNNVPDNERYDPFDSLCPKENDMWAIMFAWRSIAQKEMMENTAEYQQHSQQGQFSNGDAEHELPVITVGLVRLSGSP